MDKELIMTERDKALDAMQKIELLGLKEIDRICRKHNIKYSLGGGSCLGQVRHGGFIPWDDDIDVDMTVENYNKFIEVAPQELDSSLFVLRCRKTDPTHLRSASRLEIKGTRLGRPDWDNNNKIGRVFVDIFRLSYLPNDEKKRKKICSRLFFIRCMQLFQETGRFALKLDIKQRFRVRLLSRLIPRKALIRLEDHYIDSKRTDWLIDDALVKGDHSAYPAEGIDEYADVEFEGIKVMAKKNPDNFLRILYGEHYKDWLPPIKRISHHNFTYIDLGKFGVESGLKDGYCDLIATRYSISRLKQMKIVSDKIVNKIEEVCHNYGIDYKIAQLKEGIEEQCPAAKSLWTGPVKILMLRKDYDNFATVCQKEFGNRYEYQSHSTDPNYCYFYARVRLNHTRLRERGLPKRFAEKINQGFYVSIIPLDNCPEGYDNSINKRWNKYLRIKWKKNCFDDFMQAKMRVKIKMIRLGYLSIEDVYHKVDMLARKYEGHMVPCCFDASGHFGNIFSKSDILSEEPLRVIDSGLSKAKTAEDIIRFVSKTYGPCYLTYYDIPEAQLSSLRYDEKTGRLLTTEELLSSTLNKDVV